VEQIGVKIYVDVFMMEIGSGNNGTTLKKQNLIEEKMIFILGIWKGEEKMRKKEKKRQRIFMCRAGKKEK
jgi:hypothetical protein